VNGVYEVDKTWFADVVSDPEPLWGCDDAIIDPVGMSEFEIARASAGEALYELGLRNDDVLVSLNGKPLGTFDEAFEAFEAFALHLNDTTSYTLIVTRSGNTTTLKYKIL